MNAFLVGAEPPCSLGYTYVKEQPYDAVVMGSLTLSQVLCFSCEEALGALAAGKPVIVYEPGLPEAAGNRALAASLAARRREMKNWGIRFTDGGQKRLITAQEARQMRLAGQRPAPGAVLTPLAKEILEGTQ
jgi:hypothetical protein